jgi:hypothetical protein
MPVHRAAEHPAVCATLNTSIARITIAVTITPRPTGRRRTSITPLIIKHSAHPANGRLARNGSFLERFRAGEQGQLPEHRFQSFCNGYAAT